MGNLDNGFPSNDIIDMSRRFWAVLLIFGWVSLSGFDVLDDLDQVPGQAAVSRSSHEASSSSKRAMGALANHIDESANSAQKVHTLSVSLAPTIFAVDSLPDVHRHSQLHKLYHVFLI
jgi:hypothetical protein